MKIGLLAFSFKLNFVPFVFDIVNPILLKLSLTNESRSHQGYLQVLKYPVPTIKIHLY